MIKAPLEVVKKLSQDQKLVNKPSRYKGEDTYPVIIAAEYADPKVLDYVDSKSSVVGIAEKRNFASLDAKNLDNAKFLLEKYPSFATSTLNNQSVLVKLLSRDDQFLKGGNKSPANIEFVKDLLGKDVPIKSSEGGFIEYNSYKVTPIGLAAVKRDEWLFDLLLNKAKEKHKAKEIINEQNLNPKETALQYLAQELLGNNYLSKEDNQKIINMLNLLIEAGADLTGEKARINVKILGLDSVKKSHTLLAVMATAPHTKLVEAIINKAKASNNLLDILNEKSQGSNVTALHLVLEKLESLYLSNKKFEDVARLLMQDGARVDENTLGAMAKPIYQKILNRLNSN